MTYSPPKGLNRIEQRLHQTDSSTSLHLRLDHSSSERTAKIAVLIPCYNEEASIAAVVNDFQAALPEAVIYVYDNNSQDQTIEVAAQAGAVVRSEPLQGKGNVVRRMFADIEADVYVLVDGDDTYHAASAPVMVRALLTHNWTW